MKESELEDMIVNISNSVLNKLHEEVAPFLSNQSITHIAKSGLLGSIAATIFMQVIKIIVDNDMTGNHLEYMEEAFKKIREEVKSYIKERCN